MVAGPPGPLTSIESKIAPPPVRGNIPARKVQSAGHTRTAAQSLRPIQGNQTMARRKYQFPDRATAESAFRASESLQIATYQMLCHLTGHGPQSEWHSETVTVGDEYTDTGSAIILSSPYGPCAMMVAIGDFPPDIVTDPWKWCNEQAQYLEYATPCPHTHAISALVWHVRCALSPAPAS